MFARILIAGAVLIASLAYFLSGGTDLPQRPPYIQGRNKTVLFLANEHHGFSNAHMATAYALLENFPDLEVHFASFPKLRSTIERISSSARARTPAARDITFHSLKGISFADSCEKESAARYPGWESQDVMMGPPGLAGIQKMTRDFQWLISPWTVEEHLALYEEIGRVIDEVDPAVVVNEVFMRPAFDATRDKNRQHAVITPNTVLDNFVGDQPHGSSLWKFPAQSSGIEFPVPLRRIPENIYLNIRMISSILYTPGISAKKAALREKGLKEPINFLGLHRPDVPWITMDTEGAAIPVDFIPTNVTRAGPILIDNAPVSEQDPELAQWLKQAPTILFSPGSYFRVEEERAWVVAAALAEVLAKTQVQIIWKIKKRGEYSDEFLKPLQPYIDEGRVRVTNWLTADLYSILQTGDIIASVHHGGSNCYHEAIAAGVAQVVLPMWYDTYNFASLTEMAGVGVWGCKKTSPEWTVEDLSASMLKVIGNDELGIKIRETAKELGDKVRSREKGRDIAAQEVAKLAYIR
ncbi:unnamed protein product [Clonostachys rosea f. rosea IK726]|uniref:Uncharacterized protein n=1 Tax=Clonostachys rosea f. rosea IK726 TaxID=1349383 RepID=A0ACA9UU83_BIOOC|nr:unnamed protein product [Clonostachys rosea f. rosea IK726]